ncbi:uncharacterized protein [Venturia canescens]|uniref:uncharacterized protein n=1 Tax=Venturia canescens TaxID=32260 RepID=UPI001C9CCEDA|nr:uncharacterized protein LOC122418475 [Venturia canescens]
MRLVGLYLNLVLVVLVSCEDSSTSKEAEFEEVSSSEKRGEEIEDIERVLESDEGGERLKIIEGNPRGLKDGHLSILPPIVLLDFANDLENSSSSGEEKSKRTIEGHLGHGFARNNLFTGKYNYYFPAGKTGTSVSIEESISPFLPKTIIESAKPTGEKSHAGEASSNYNGQGQNKVHQAVPGNRASGQVVKAELNRPLGTQPVFGQRTKLYKPSQIDYNYQSFGTSPRTPVEAYATPDYRQNSQDSSQSSFATARPSYQANPYESGYYEIPETSQRPYNGYSTVAPPSFVTPTASAYQAIYSSNSPSGNVTPRPGLEGPTSQRPPHPAYHPESPLAQFANLPRFTIENGVRYENKIVWKYPDGKVSQTPPSSYVNAYNEFLTKQKPGAAPSQSNEVRSTFQIPGGVTSGQSFQYQPQLRFASQKNRFPSKPLSNIHSKSPAQFPNDQPRPGRPSHFVSSASLGSQAGLASQGVQPAPQAQPYEPTFQGQYGQKTSTRYNQGAIPPSGYSDLVNDEPRVLKDSYGATTSTEQRPVSKYAVNSPNPEYTFSTEPSIKSTTPSSDASLFTPSGELSPKVLSKYSSEAQKYLSKVFASGGTTTERTRSATEEPRPLLSYENLLNYNPSINQYIRDPSSILKAQPTFIQAGNSLIPVIILRVDGASPIRQRPTPNINLKALLQQYLTQYAGSIAQNANYENTNYEKPLSFQAASNAPQNPVYELTQLAQSLSQYSQNPLIANQLAKQLDTLNQSPYDNPNGPSLGYEANEQFSKNLPSESYVRKASKQKVKSVQIIEDPRFTSYKVNS